MNQLRKLSLVIPLSLIITGCSLSERNIKLHTEKEVTPLVEERYGKAELIDIENIESPHRKRIFTYKDSTYGFVYQVISMPNSVGMDGSTFYYNGAMLRYEYSEPFYEYFNNTEYDSFSNEGIELRDKLSVSNHYDTDRIFSIRDSRLVTTVDKAEDDIEFTWNKLGEYNLITDGYKLDVYTSDTLEFYGTKMKDRFQGADEWRAEYYIEQAEFICDIQGFKYLRTEEKRVKDVPELQEQNFYDSRIKDRNRKVRLYYFEYGNKEYFIADVQVAQHLEEDGITSRFQFYQNYKEFSISE